jgi:hypothetical protein
MAQVVKNAVVENVTKIAPKVEIEISVRELIDRLFAIRGTTFVRIEATTEPKMNLGGLNHDNRLLGNVLKDSITNCIIGFSYENMVNNAQAREITEKIRDAAIDAGVTTELIKNYEDFFVQIGKDTNKEEPFTAKKQPWAVHCVNEITGETSKIVVRKANIKLGGIDSGERYAMVAVLNAKTPVWRYKDTGKVMTEEDIAYAKSYITEKTEGTRQNLENPIYVRTFSIDKSVTRIQLNKTMYVIK